MRTNRGVLLCTLGLACAGIGAVPAVAGAQYSGDLDRVIPDGGKKGYALDATPYKGTVDQVSVAVRISHPYVGELRISLRSPSGTKVALVKNRGGDGDNFGSGTTDCDPTTTEFTALDDLATPFDPISTGTAPFDDSTYGPEQPLATFDGETIAGTWKLIIADNALDNQGILHCWYLGALPAFS